MGRIRFANQLRGVAALCVACSHLVGVFWAMPGIVSSVTATPPQHGDLPGLFWLVAHQWFNLGPFGVAIFFLISGMVVPFSLDKHTSGSFILARLLRIYPTYAAALLLEVAAITVSSRVWDRPLPFTPSIVLGNLTLLYDLIGQPSIDLVNWTLSVELKFYFAIVLVAPLVRRGCAGAIIALGGVICAANMAMAAGLFGNLGAPPSTPSYTFSSQSLCLIYMLIGTLFNFHLRGKLGTTGLLAGIAALSGLFVATWLVGVWRTQFPVVTVNYGYALALFTALYAVRDRVPPNRLLDGMADISFPFYVLHSLIGYTLLRSAMVGLKLAYDPALAITVAILFGLSLALHRLVERPTQRLGRHIGVKMTVAPRPWLPAKSAADDGSATR